MPVTLPHLRMTGESCVRRVGLISITAVLSTPLLLTSLLLTLAGCTQNATPPQAAAASPYLPKASIRELMDSLVDPASDVIWESVVYTVTEAGEEAHQPRTPEEWKDVRRGALNLVEATNLLMMEGRHIAPPGQPREAGEASTEVLQKKLDENRDAFVGFAQALRATGLKALDAVDSKDVNGLLQVGGEIDEACEACHLVFWYPPELSKR